MYKYFSLVKIIATLYYEHTKGLIGGYLTVINYMNEIKKRKKLRYALLAAIFIIIAGWTLTVYIIGPERVINTVGEGNSYVLSFFLGLIGGSSFLTSAPFYAAIYSLSSGGLNPYLLGIIAGIGLAIGDALYYLLGHEGRKILPWRIKNKVNRLSEWIKKKNSFIVLSMSFLYIAFIPLPNDILLTVLGLAKYPFKKIVPILIAGDIAFLILLGVIARMYGAQLY